MGGFFKNKTNLVSISIIILAILFILYRVFTNAYIGGTNDMEPHAYHLWNLRESLINYGEVPSWTSDFFGGKPFLGLYQPLTYFMFLPISLIFPISATKFCFLIIHLISAIFFYFLAKRLFKNKYIILSATLLFAVFPHKLALTGAGTLAQLAAEMFVPIMFLIYEKNKEKFKLYYLAWIGLLLGLCMLTHHAVGGSLFAGLLIFIIYDYTVEKRKDVLKIIPFLILGIIIALVFLIPAYQIQNTLNFGVTEAGGAGFKPLTYARFFNKSAEHLGIIGFIAILFGFIQLRMKNIKKKSPITKYIFVSLAFLLIGLYFHFLIPNFIKGTLQNAHRMFSVLSTTLPIAIIIGAVYLSKYLVLAAEKFKIITAKKETFKKISKFVLIITILWLLIEFGSMKPGKNELNIPDGILKFYENISTDEEYYRVEDQAFSPFGFSSVLHRHGVLNGAPMQEAPKYHFYFWSSAWGLLNTDAGKENFAGLYGILSIKYFLSAGELKIPHFKKVDSGQNYYIYENERVLDYVRLVPNIGIISVNEPDHIPAFLNALASSVAPFDQLAFVHSTELQPEKITLEDLKSEKAELLERKPGYLKVKIEGITKMMYLAVAESYHPYWKAVQDGKELKIYEGVPSTLIIPIEKDGTVEISYIPPKIRTYLFYLSLLVGLGLIGVIIYCLKWKK